MWSVISGESDQPAFNEKITPNFPQPQTTQEKMREQPIRKYAKPILGSTQSLVPARKQEKETLHSYIKDLRTFVRTPKPSRKLSLKIRGEKIEIQNIIAPPTPSKAAGIARRYSRAGNSDLRRNKKEDDIVFRGRNVRSSIDKVDEVTKSIFKDYKNCDKNVEMVDIDFL